MKKVLAIIAVVLAACAAAHAQVAPAANAGPASFGWSLNYAQAAEFGSGIGDTQTINANGSIHYSTGFERAPFSVAYSGGYTWTIAGDPYASGYFQHILVSQGYLWRKFRISVSDNLTFLPQAPITGFAGVAGTGQPIGTPNPAPTSDQTILTVKTTALDNFSTVSFSDRISRATFIDASGGYGFLSYPDNDGIDTNSEDVTAGVSQRLNARMKLTSSYSYSQFSYPDYDLSFQSNTVYAGFSRAWTRRLSMNVSGGPQWSSSSDSTLIPSTLNFAIDGSGGYHFKTMSINATYQRGVSGGAGYLLGAHSDVVSANMSRGFFGRNAVSVALEGSYRRIASLSNSGNNSGVVSSEDIGVQASKRLGTHLNAFVGYSLITQGFNGSLPSNVLGATLQSVSFGFGFSPRESRIIR